MLTYRLFEGSVYGRQAYSLPIGSYLSVEVFPFRGEWHLSVRNNDRQVIRIAEIGSHNIASESVVLRKDLQFSFARIRKRSGGTAPAVMSNPGDFGRGWINLIDIGRSNETPEQILYLKFSGCLAWNTDHAG